MSVIDPAATIQRIDALLRVPEPTDTRDSYVAAVEAYLSTLTMVTTLYGPTSQQTQTLLKATEHARQEKGDLSWTFTRGLRPVVQGTLRAMRLDVQAGLVGNSERQVAGELLADLLGLAKGALANDNEGAKNVAAVLAAATFEDTIREMGATLAGVVDRPELADVVKKLEAAGVLAGAPRSTAAGYLTFRNDALRADWARLTPAIVGSCIRFTEGLLRQHFS